MLVAFLRANADVFAWQPSDMPGVPREVIEHHLVVRPDAHIQTYDQVVLDHLMAWNGPSALHQYLQLHLSIGPSVPSHLLALLHCLVPHCQVIAYPSPFFAILSHTWSCITISTH